MTRPVAALNSGLLVRKGMASPLGLETTERTPNDVVRAVRPSLALIDPYEEPAIPFIPASATRVSPPVVRSRDPLGRLTRLWSTLAKRWGLPTLLFLAGLSMIAIVAVTGPGTAPSAGATGSVAPILRPPGPTPVTWVDFGLMTNPALAGR